MTTRIQVSGKQLEGCAGYLHPESLKRKEIKHPDPETAVSLALIQLAFTLRDMMLLSTMSEEWSSLMPKDDKQLVRELTRGFLNYLGVK